MKSHMKSMHSMSNTDSLSKAKAFAKAALASHEYYSLFQGFWPFAAAYAAAAAGAYANRAAAWGLRK